MLQFFKALFNKRTKIKHPRILFRDEELKRIRSVIHQSTAITGAEYVCNGGIAVLGQLTGNKLLATRDQSPVLVALQGAVEGGVIDAHDILIEGRLHHVQISAEGRIEIGPEAQVSGTLLKGPMAEVYISPTADVSEMTMRSAAHVPQAATLAKLRNGTHG